MTYDNYFSMNYPSFFRAAILDNTCERLPPFTNSGIKKYYPNRHLLVQSQQQKQQKNIWNLFKVHKKGTRKMSLYTLKSSEGIVTSFWYLCF